MDMSAKIYDQKSIAWLKNAEDIFQVIKEIRQVAKKRGGTARLLVTAEGFSPLRIEGEACSFSVEVILKESMPQ